MNQPKQIIMPWAENGLKNDIPNIRELSTPQEGATYQDGFPSITMTPISVGGKPPSGRDMNGILYEITANLAFLGRGKHYKFNQDYCSAINGYPKGAILVNNAETALYISRVDQNQIDFNVQPNNENWIMLADTALKSELSTEINKKANIASPAFTGTPTAPTPAQTVNNTQIATTEFVKTAIAALVGSAPAALDTLEELASALAGDANLKATLLAEIGKKANASHTHTASNISDFNTAVTQLFTQSANQQGWVKLPNGLIFQWGHSVQQSNTTQMYDITDRQASFPISFPKTCFSVFITAQESQGAEEVENTFAVTDHQLNLFRYRMYRVGGSNDPKETVRINFFAIGM